MTDEQFLWLFVNQSIDADEKLEGMCPTCRREVTSSKHKCSRCGKHIGDDKESTGFVNPNFDSSRFNKLSNGDTDICEEVEEDI